MGPESAAVKRYRIFFAMGLTTAILEPILHVAARLAPRGRKGNDMTDTANTKTTSFYRNGDLCRYTGKSEVLYGGLFFEFVWVDGHRAGETGLTGRKPS